MYMQRAVGRSPVLIALNNVMIGSMSTHMVEYRLVKQMMGVGDGKLDY